MLLLAPRALAQHQPPPDLPPAVDSKDEPFDKVDPYTKGDPAAMEKAGYVSFGPFLFAQGIKTQDVEEALGGSQVLWLETAHFKIGSTLKTYKFQGDQREEKRFKEELARLKPRFDKFKPPSGKLDPWLRLHLHALRLEELYADTLKRFGLTDADFDPAQRAKGGPELGPGPYLGMEHKFTVLLLEKESGLARVGRRFVNQEFKGFIRWKVGESMLLVMSAEGVRGYGYSLDAAFSAMTISEATHSLIDGCRAAWVACPLWFKYGLAHANSRRIDERFTISALGTTRELGDDSYKWQPRIERLLANGFVKGWDEMLAWGKWEDIKPQGHMLAWSRVSWLVDRKDGNHRQLLLDLCEPFMNVPDAQRTQFIADRTRKALQNAFGRTVEELDAEWRAFVEKKDPK